MTPSTAASRARRRTPSTSPLRTVLAAGLATVLAGALAGCGSSAATSSSSAGGREGYPLTLENCGREVTVEQPPQRAVSLNQGSTEILLSLGLADRVAGTATWTDPVLPELADANASVDRLADDNPSYERLLGAEPDLVTASFAGTLGEGGVTTPDALADLGVPAYLSPAECTAKDNEGSSDGTRVATLEIDTIYQEVTDLARVFGVEERGEELVAELRDRMRAATDSIELVDPEDTSVMFWFANAESPYLAGCCGGPGIISRQLGLDNVLDDTRDEWPQISWETVADRDPDVLVLGDLTRRSQTAESGAAKIDFLERNPVTRNLTAVREGRYVLVSGGALNPSIRTVLGTEQVAEGLVDLGLATRR